MPVTARLQLIASFVQTGELDLGNRFARHKIEYPGDLKVGGEYASGTADYQQDEVWSDRRTVANGAPDTLDLRGVLAGALGDTVDLVEVAGLCIVNRSTSLAQTLAVGGDANAASAGIFGAPANTVTVPPGGCFFWHSPLDGAGITVTAGTADIIQIASASGDITYDIVVWGRLS